MKVVDSLVRKAHETEGQTHEALEAATTAHLDTNFSLSAQVSHSSNSSE